MIKILYLKISLVGLMKIGKTCEKIIVLEYCKLSTTKKKKQKKKKKKKNANSQF